MRTRLISTLLLTAIALPSTRAIAQDTEKANEKPRRTAKYAEPRDNKPAVGVEVIPAPRVPGVLKEWTLNHTGSIANGVTVYVTSVQLWSDGRMRWNLSFWNRSNEVQTFYFDFEEMIIADPQSNPYQQLARNIISGNRGSIYMRSIPRDQRFNTWVDYKAPQIPTLAFKVSVMLEGRRDHRADAFKPFQITLNEPLFLDNGVFRIEGVGDGVAIHEEGADGVSPGGGSLGGGSQGSRPAGLRSGTRPFTPKSISPGSNPSEKSMEELRETFLALSEKGMTLNGTLVRKSGGTMPGRMVFLKRPLSELVEARIVNTFSGPRKGTFLIDCEVIGAFLEDLTRPSGLSLKMVDFAKVRYSFSLAGNSLSGEDSLGNTYIFQIPTR